MKPRVKLKWNGPGKAWIRGYNPLEPGNTIMVTRTEAASLLRDKRFIKISPAVPETQQKKEKPKGVKK